MKDTVVMILLALIALMSWVGLLNSNQQEVLQKAVKLLETDQVQEVVQEEVTEDSTMSVEDVMGAIDEIE